MIEREVAMWVLVLLAWAVVIGAVLCWRARVPSVRRPGRQRRQFHRSHISLVVGTCLLGILACMFFITFRI